jgi:hypothetical protein
MSALLKIDAVALWLDGVLAPSLADLCAQVFFAKPLASVDVNTRIRLWAAGEQLALGRIDTAEFSAQTISICGAAMTPADCEDALRAALVLREDVCAIVRELPAQTTCWVICGLPRAWVDVTTLTSVIPPERWLFSHEMHLPHLTPDVFTAWAVLTRLPMHACMMVDAETPRAVEAVKHRLHAAIYVDPKRLRREFVLRRMLPPPPGFIYPGNAAIEKDAGQ